MRQLRWPARNNESLVDIADDTNIVIIIIRSVIDTK